MLKKIIIKVHLWLTLYKPVAKYQFSMSCVQYVVMIHLSEQVILFEEFLAIRRAISLNETFVLFC